MSWQSAEEPEATAAPGCKAIETVIPNATTLKPRDWEQVKQTTTWNGDNLYNWGLWNVLLSKNTAVAGHPPVLSSEAGRSATPAGRAVRAIFAGSWAPFQARFGPPLVQTRRAPGLCRPSLHSEEPRRIDPPTPGLRV